MDVLYVGNLASDALERFWHNRANRYWHDSYNPVVCDAIADAALAQRDRSFHLSVQTALAQLGKGWDKIGPPANVELGAETDYDEFLRLAGQAKICLDASTYLDGANDRVFSSALNRAVCFTNAASYLCRAFGKNDGMRFYSMHNLSELGTQVKMLLARPNELREAGERARQAVPSSHTWRHRVGGILGAMRLGSGTMTGVLPPVPRR